MKYQATAEGGSFFTENASYLQVKSGSLIIGDDPLEDPEDGLVISSAGFAQGSSVIRLAADLTIYFRAASDDGAMFTVVAIA